MTRKYQSEQLGNLLGKYVSLDKIKTRKPKTLFPIDPVWERLRDYRCPFCNSKIKYTRDRTKAYCRGKRHMDGERFYVPSQKIEEIRTKLQSKL